MLRSMLLDAKAASLHIPDAIATAAPGGDLLD